MSKNLHVANSPFTRNIYAGSVLKDGMTFGANQTDVTTECFVAVAKVCLAHDGGSTIISSNGKPRYEITVKELA